MSSSSIWIAEWYSVVQIDKGQHAAVQVRVLHARIDSLRCNLGSTRRTGCLMGSIQARVTDEVTARVQKDV
jgi:hypothetical protein